MRESTSWRKFCERHTTQDDTDRALVDDDLMVASIHKATVKTRLECFIVKDNEYEYVFANIKLKLKWIDMVRQFRHKRRAKRSGWKWKVAA